VNIGLFHGYNLTGSGSNEFTRYLAKTFIAQGHAVHVICREYHPEKLDFIGQLWRWKADGSCVEEIVSPDLKDVSVVHQIPYGEFYPVYISGKKSSTVFREFVSLTDQELENFRFLNETLLRKIFSRISIDILHTNHLVMQPCFAIEPCRESKIPFIIYPHGSAIEYAVKRDPRYMLEARRAIESCSGLIIGNQEVKNRIVGLFPDLQDRIDSRTRIVGVGVDTALFRPLKRHERASSIENFLVSQIPDFIEGKSPEHVKTLQVALDHGDYESIAHGSDVYTQNNLDTDVRQKLLSIDLDQPIVIFVGALTAGKGLQSLMTALPAIYREHPGAQLLVIGAGDFRESLESLIYGLATRNEDIIRYLAQEKDSSIRKLWQDVMHYLENLQNPDEYFSQSFRLLQQVKFLGRFNHKQLSYIFPISDLAVFPSVIPEAYPLVLMESLANGVLPLVSYFSGFRDGVDELNQFLDASMVDMMKISMAKENRVAQIVDHVSGLLNMGLGQDIRDKLQVIAESNYDWKHRGLQMAEAYRELS